MRPSSASMHVPHACVTSRRRSSYRASGEPEASTRFGSTLRAVQHTLRSILRSLLAAVPMTSGAPNSSQAHNRLFRSCEAHALDSHTETVPPTAPTHAQRRENIVPFTYPTTSVAAAARTAWQQGAETRGHRPADSHGACMRACSGTGQPPVRTKRPLTRGRESAYRLRPLYRTTVFVASVRCFFSRKRRSCSACAARAAARERLERGRRECGTYEKNASATGAGAREPRSEGGLCTGQRGCCANGADAYTSASALPRWEEMLELGDGAGSSRNACGWVSAGEAQ